METQIHNKPILIIDDHPVVAMATEVLLSKIDRTLPITSCHCAQSAIRELEKIQTGSESSLISMFQAHMVFHSPDNSTNMVPQVDAQS